MADTEFTATFNGATRKGASASGNPTWTLHTSEGDYVTGSDAAIGYDIENHTNSRPYNRDNYWIDQRVTFTRTPTGRITDWRRATD